MKITGFNIENNCESIIYKEISLGRFPHAAIIEGGTPEERMALAGKISAALVCTGGEPRPCGICPNCIKAAADSHPDIHVYSAEDKAKAFKVDMVRDIRAEAYILPNEADRKVFILENAHSMGLEGQNAILKVLEEPPAYVNFLLLCSSKSGFLPTVLSRAAVYSLGQAKLSDENAIPREKLVSAASDIAASLAGSDDFETVKAAGQFEKDAALLKASLPVMQEIFAAALRIKFDAGDVEEDISEISVKLSSRLTRRSLLEASEVIDGLIESVRQNANHNLTVTRLCTLLRRAVSN